MYKLVEFFKSLLKTTKHLQCIWTTTYAVIVHIYIFLFQHRREYQTCRDYEICFGVAITLPTYLFYLNDYPNTTNAIITTTLRVSNVSVTAQSTRNKMASAWVEVQCLDSLPKRQRVKLCFSIRQLKAEPQTNTLSNVT